VSWSNWRKTALGEAFSSTDEVLRGRTGKAYKTASLSA
jgi:hypothetical protein